VFIIIAVEPGHFPQPPCSDSQEAESEIVEVATNGPRTGQVFQSSQHAHLHRAMSGCSALVTTRPAEGGATLSRVRMCPFVSRCEWPASQLVCIGTRPQMK
jgi:hypothetical protein